MHAQNEKALMAWRAMRIRIVAGWDIVFLDELSASSGQAAGQRSSNPPGRQ
jgi:hypothetical protein